MNDRTSQQATQLRNIEEATGLSVDDFVKAVGTAGLSKHGEILKYLKAEMGMSHGNANLIARLVREEKAGGPASESELLAQQYAGGKTHLRDILDALTDVATGLGGDVERVVLRTGVSFRRRKQFALVEAPSSKRVQLGVNLDETPANDRVKEVKGMCTHRIEVTDPAEVDSLIVTILQESYDRSG